MTVTPPMYGTSTSGTRTVPSACWKFSRMAATVRPTARPDPFSVCANSGLAPAAGRYLIWARRAWKSVKFEHDEISRYRPELGSQTSRSKV